MHCRFLLPNSAKNLVAEILDYILRLMNVIMVLKYYVRTQKSPLHPDKLPQRIPSSNSKKFLTEEFPYA